MSTKEPAGTAHHRLAGYVQERPTPMTNRIRSVTLRALIAVLLGAVLAATMGVATPATPAGASGSAPAWEPDPSSVGGLSFFNSQGQQITGGNVTDAPLAAYVQGATVINPVNTRATLFVALPVPGELPTAWTTTQVSTSTAYPNASAPAPLGTSALPVLTDRSTDLTVAGIEGALPNTSGAYANLYELRLKTSGGGNNVTYDSADISVDTVNGVWSVIYPALTPIATTTTLTASPPGPTLTGTPVTLTATVGPSAPGTVQFENGTTPIGGAVTVAGGQAQTTTSSLPVGADALHAVFTPAPFADDAGSTGDLSYTIATAPAITSAGSVTFTRGTAGSFTVTTTGFPAPTVSETGTLPTGVTFAAGVLSGTPTASGSFPITFGATNGTTVNATQAFTLTVLAMAITTTSLPDGSVYSKSNKVLYSATLAESGGIPPVKWSLAPGSAPLPPGLKLNSKGVISGKAKTAGTYPFTVQVVDKKSKTKPPVVDTATATLAITIS